jgi:uncharacterized protein
LRKAAEVIYASAVYLKSNVRGDTLKNMKSCVLLESNTQNKYFNDRKAKKTQLCHPLLHYILRLSLEGIDVRSWIDNLEDGSIEIENYGHFLKKEVDYYYQKYLLLKEDGYFAEIDQEEILSAKLNEEDVKKFLANCRQVVFEVTDKCQMNCEYCGYGKFYHGYDKREKKHLDIRSAKTLLNYLVDLWNSPLNESHERDIFISFYGGEPLLNFPFIKEVVDFVKHLKALHNRFNFSMTTNGLLLERSMDFLYENKFGLLISLDGNQENNSYRVLKNGRPAYKDILRNVRALQKKYPDYFSTRVNFNAVLHNKNSVSEIYKFFKTHFDKIPSISELNTSGIKDSQKEKFWKTYSNINESLYQSEDYSLIEEDMFVRAPKIQMVMRFLFYQNDFSFNNYKDLIYSDRKQKRTPTGTCLPFSRKIFVTVNGKILPCERIDFQYGLGSVNPEKVDLSFEKITEKYNAYYNKIRKQCNVCHNTETCLQCIFHLNIEDNNPVCKGFMTHKDYAKYISSIINYIEENPETYPKILKEAIFD